jgi:hypothetical protein
MFGPSTFFRASLLLPVFLPLVLLPFGNAAITVILVLSLTFGGVQYVLFAGWLFFWIGPSRSSRQIRRLLFWAPIAFVPIQALGWLAYVAWGASGREQFGRAFGALPLFSAFTLLVGYFYVGLTIMVFLISRKIGLVKEVQV